MRSHKPIAFAWTHRVALVTGASSGIGLAVAQAIVRRGGHVALVARTAERLQRVARSLGEARAAAFPLDVADREALMALPAQIVQRFGRLDVVVNNAGVNHRGPVEDRSEDELVSIVETNLLAPILLSRAALPHLGTGAFVVNVASLAGKVPVPDEATYSATKAGLRAFTRSRRSHGAHERNAGNFPGRSRRG